MIHSTKIGIVDFDGTSVLQLDDRVLCRIYKKNGHSQRVQGVERDESPSADEVMASLPDIDQQNKLQLPKIASFSGLLESDDPFIDGFLNDEAMDGNGNSSKLPQV